MEVTVTESGPCRKTLAIVVPPEEVQQSISEAFAAASKQAKIKGFRAGKVPRSVLEKRFGDEIRAEAKENLVRSKFEAALGVHDLRPLGQPELEGIDESPLDENAALSFQVHFDVRPVFEVKQTRGLEIQGRSAEVTDDDMTAALARLADEKRTLKTVESAIEDGDFVTADLSFRNEAGEEVLARQGARLNTGIPIAGTDPSTFAESLRGRETGQDFELDITFPDTFEKEEVRGQKGTVAISIKEVQRVMPAAIDDELAKSYDFDSLDALKEDLRKRLETEKARAERTRREEELLAVLANENPFDLPVSMVDEQAAHLLHDFEHRMREAGVGDDEIKARLEEAKAEARAEAERRVRAFFLVEAIAKKEKIFVTETDVDVELRNIAAQNEVPVGKVREHYEKHRLLGDLRMSLMERKVLDFLRENAKVSDESA